MVVSYEWREGAAVLAAGVTPMSRSSWDSPLTLRVVDNKGASATDSVVVTVIIRPPAPPVANAVWI